MDEPDNRITRTSGMTTWRAGCTETRTSGSEGGPQKPTRRKPDRALRPDPYTRLGGAAKWNWFYLASVLDLGSRRLLGYSMAAHMRTELVLDALGMAIAARDGNVPGVIAHADRGSQYTSNDYLDFCQADQLRPSVAESFWASLKPECIRGRVFATRAETGRAIFTWITWYNSKRLHSSVDHTPPCSWEQQYRQAS